MKYTTIKRFKRRGIDGQFTVPYATEVERHGDFLCLGGRKICVARSFAAHEHFARNDDGSGLERGKLSHGIIDVLGGFSGDSEAWKRIFADELAQKYRRPEHSDYWLWNDDFFNAPIEDLKYLAELVKGV